MTQEKKYRKPTPIEVHEHRQKAIQEAGVKTQTQLEEAYNHLCKMFGFRQYQLEKMKSILPISLEMNTSRSDHELVVSAQAMDAAVDRAVQDYLAARKEWLSVRGFKESGQPIYHSDIGGRNRHIAGECPWVEVEEGEEAPEDDTQAWEGYS